MDNILQRVYSRSREISSIGGKCVVRGGWNWSQSGIIQQNAPVTYYGRGMEI